jgi:aspartate/glutamate racemase
LHLIEKVSSAIEATVRIPLLHIADPTAMKIREAGYSKVGLLGTRFTMGKQAIICLISPAKAEIPLRNT